MRLVLGSHTLNLSHPVVMGVLNRTPDSFSDGGEFTDFELARQHAQQMARDGAAIIDVGGESTRPGAQAVSAAQELQRVVPLVERLAAELDVPISIDTSKPQVMRAAVAAGASMINDVYALRQPGALDAARDCGAAVCLMHMQGEPRSMQEAPYYRDVVAEVGGFLRERVDACVQAGIKRERLLIDPGFGFGKTLDHNLELLRRLGTLCEQGLPLMAGLSRKSSIGELLGGVPAGERLYGSIAAAVVATMNGAKIIRAHDVKPTVEALRIASAVLQ